MSRILDLEITCPECGTEFEASGHTIVDAADSTDNNVLQELQEGSINIARCPNCKASGLIPVPVLLHEPVRELLLAFVPNAEEMNEEDISSLIGPMLESFISSIPEEKQGDYLFEPVVTDDPMALVMAARGETLEEEEFEYDDDDDEYENDDGEELTEEELAEVQARQQLLQQLLSVDPLDSLTRISLLRQNQQIVDDMLVQLVSIVSDQARNIQPEAIPILNKILNEIEVFLASR
jgi:DNA-binding TFAR19-related protein (PDSD5 family)